MGSTTAKALGMSIDGSSGSSSGSSSSGSSSNDASGNLYLLARLVYSVYINTRDGEEEPIFKIINTENGQLVI